MIKVAGIIKVHAKNSSSFNKGVGKTAFQTLGGPTARRPSRNSHLHAAAKEKRGSLGHFRGSELRTGVPEETALWDRQPRFRRGYQGGRGGRWGREKPRKHERVPVHSGCAGRGLRLPLQCQGQRVCVPETTPDDYALQT